MKRLVLLTILMLFASACSDSAGSDTTESQEVSTSTSQAPQTTTTTSVAPTTSSTPETTVTTSVSSDPADTSLASPLEVGRVVRVGDWRLRVSSITPDALEQVMEENEFNDPPGDGTQFLMVGLDATYAGEETGSFWVDITLKVVGESAVAYESFDAGCGVIPDDITNTGEVFPGGTTTGNACWNIHGSDADSLVLIIEDWASFDDDRAFLSLDSAATPVDETTSIGLPGLDFELAPIGSPVEVGGWSITVTDVTPDATEAVLAESSFNDAPPPGSRFFMAHLEAEYVGSESGSFWADLELKALGESRVAYEQFGSGCGSVPDDIFNSGETFPGGVITGNVCWTVSNDDVPGLIMLAEESFGFEGDHFFFELSG